MDVSHPDPARIALITQCDSHITYLPTVPNLFLRQFDPVVETIHTIHSDALIRIAQLDRSCAPRLRLDGARLTFTNIHEALV
jgi:hypothetical protein